MLKMTKKKKKKKKNPKSIKFQIFGDFNVFFGGGEIILLQKKKKKKEINVATDRFGRFIRL